MRAAGVTPRSVVRRRSRRVSSAAMMSASPRAARRRSDASSVRPIGAAASVSVPVVCTSPSSTTSPVHGPGRARSGESRRYEVHDRPGFPPYDVGVVAMTGLEPAAPQSQRDRRPPSLRQWLAPAIPGSRLMGWLAPLLVTLFAGVLRFYDLAKPRAVIFDETYYAKDAYALLKFGYEHNTVKNADKLLLQNPPNYHIWADGGSFVAHPPAGKWLIAVGEWIFGMTPFGWRFSAALIGTLSVLILARVARRMTRSTLLGCAAGLLLAVDGMHLVTSRTAILDIFVMFWILAGFACLVIDRDVTRAALARKIGETGNESDLGPFVMHWWRIGAALCLGTAVATKWTGVYYIAAFGLMALLWDIGARRAAGVRQPYAGG